MARSTSATPVKILRHGVSEFFIVGKMARWNVIERADKHARSSQSRLTSEGGDGQIRPFRWARGTDLSDNLGFLGMFVAEDHS